MCGTDCNDENSRNYARIGGKMSKPKDIKDSIPGFTTYVYDGPPYISGDISCSKCGGTEFMWVGECRNCINDKINKWEKLLLKIVEHYAVNYTDESIEWRNGYEAALGWMGDQMKELEEK
jgi:hypothetical protein